MVPGIINIFPAERRFIIVGSTDRKIARNDNNKINNDYGQHSGFDKNNSLGYNDNYFSYKEKQVKLEKINREFDQKIVAVQHNTRLSSREKVKQVQWLQTQRNNEISKVEYQYAKSNQKAERKTPGHDSHKW